METISFDLFLDESGDHLLYSPDDYESDEALETHCTLVGTIVSYPQKGALKEKLSEIKKHFWNTDDVVLHSVEIRHKKGPFAIFHYKPELYVEFKEKMNVLVKEVSPVIICSSLNKHLWVIKYPRKLHFKDDPYEEAFVYLLERYAHFLNAQKKEGVKVIGRIIAEQRGGQKDKELVKVYKNIREGGTQYFRSANHFDCLPEKMDFIPKKYNVPGLQLSDYCCYPFYKNHKFPRSENEHYDFLETFIYPGDYGKYGHKRWPV